MILLRAFALCGVLLAGCLSLGGCSGAPHTLPPGFVADQDVKAVEPASPEIMHLFEAGLNKEYQLGPGDLVEVLAPALPEIAGVQTVSPNGSMTLYPSGELKVGGKTRTEAEALIKGALRRYFDPPALTLRINSFENNMVNVMGRVTTPGAVKFRGRPNLLEALTRAGLFSGGAQAHPPSNCAIIRGKDQMLWVSLDEMLHGGASGRNLDLAGNDIVYVPDLDEANVYVLGEVNKPGAFEVASVKSLLNAIAQAGGATENAVTGSVMLVRNKGPEAGKPIKISLDTIINDADFSKNIRLAKNDIIYLPPKGIARLGYYLRMINPFTQFVLTGYALGKL